jgi:RHS repeat-associated protein
LVIKIRLDCHIYFIKILRQYIKTPEKYVTTGHERDTETGLDYRGARFYDADVARFLSLDPLAAEFPAWSDYNYVLGNPVMLVDPDGKAPEVITPETVWDIINVAMGVSSFTANALSGNVVGALVDAAGLIYDGVATATPILPGGASSMIGAYRLASFANRTVDALVTVKKLFPADKSQKFYRLIDKANNSVIDHGKIKDVTGAVQEKLGMTLSITQRTGETFNHIEEVTGTIKSLKNAADALTDKIAHYEKYLPDDKSTIEALKEAKTTTNNLAKKYQTILDKADEVAKALPD